MSTPLSEDPEQLVRLVLTLNPVAPHWEFTPPSCATQTCLIGWVMAKPSVDAGVPNTVAALFARVLARCAMVTFFSDSTRSIDGVESTEHYERPVTQVIKPTGLLGAVVHKGYPLTSSQDPAIVQTLFDADGFSWPLKAQRAFLSAPGVLPDLQFKDVDMAFNRPQALECEELVSKAHVLGMLLPGVDGDFAGIVAFSNDFWTRFMDAFEAENRESNIAWSAVDEANFRATSW